MIENGDILVSFSIQTIEKCVIQCHQHMEVKRMPLSEFFQTYLSPEKLGIEEDGYNYESFCAFALKEKASTITTYYSKQNLCLYRFMFFQSAHSNIILCSLIRITNTENKDYFTNRDVLTGVYTRSTLLQKLE